MKITAAVIRDPQAPYSIEQLELREPGQGEVLVRIVGVGMCHTDVLPRIPGIGMPLPIVCGHEGAGIVQAVGPGVTAVAVGDHVVMSFDSCGACTNCRTGHPAYCETFMLRNLSGFRADLTTPMSADGGEMIAGSWFGQSSFASHSLATERNVVKVDDDLPLEQLGPLGCGLQTGAGSVLVAMKARPGTSIAVFGTGAVGIAAVMAARSPGARRSSASTSTTTAWRWPASWARRTRSTAPTRRSARRSWPSPATVCSTRSTPRAFPA